MTKPMPRFALALLMALAISLQLSISPASAQQPVQDNLWITNENVRTSVIAGDTLYLGGDFTHVGPATGHAVSIDATSGAVDASFPKTNGDVYSIIADNNGGWYVGGEFSNIGGANINNLAHVRLDKTIDPSFTPNPNNIVRTVAVSGGTVYVGGNFTVISGQPRNRLAAINGTTGKVLAWNPNPVAANSSDTVVLSLAISGDVVYVGGQFSTIGGLPQNGLGAINAATAQAVASCRYLFERSRMHPALLRPAAPFTPESRQTIRMGALAITWRRCNPLPDKLNGSLSAEQPAR